MTDIDTTTYNITPDQAAVLLRASLVDRQTRSKVLRKYVAKHGNDALLDLFVEFIAAANSVADNCREHAANEFLAQGVSNDPYLADKINMPSIEGAMQGVIVADTIDPKGACAGCAYRLGTIANQCFATTTDAIYCGDGSVDFQCHEHLDEKGNPTRRCVGFARSLKAALAGQSAPGG